ncbi:MAG: hypothetical protein WCG75_11170 [Armatimonadota bacterium]
MSEQQPKPQFPCPKCGNLTPVGSETCITCGNDFRKYVQTGGATGKYPFSFIWFAALFFIVPLGACGGCIVDFRIASFSAVTMLVSVAAGLCLLLYNGIKGRQ